MSIEGDGRVGGGMSMRIGSDVHHRTAELGSSLAEPLWGGIVTAAVREMLIAARACDVLRIAPRLGSGIHSDKVPP